METSKVSTNNVMQENQRVPKNELGQEAFLKILVTQLQNQDPLEGGDNAEYIAQLAQFSSLEQMQSLNQGMSQMMYYQNAQYASDMIGKHVTLNNGEDLINGVVDKVKFMNGYVGIEVDGLSYFVEQVVEVSDTEIEIPEDSEVKKNENLKEV